MLRRNALLGVLLGLAAEPCHAVPNCHVGTAYTVLVSGRADRVGEDILVRRNGARSLGTCDGAQQSGDFPATGPDEPGYFLWLDGRYLALDLGTSTARQLRIMNLATRKSVWTDDVADDPTGRPSTGAARLVWRVDAQVPLKACPAAWRNEQKIEPQITTAHRITELHFDVATGKMRKTGRTACSFQESDVSLPTPDSLAKPRS